MMEPLIPGGAAAIITLGTSPRIVAMDIPPQDMDVDVDLALEDGSTERSLPGSRVPTSSPAAASRRPHPDQPASPTDAAPRP